MTFFGFLGGLVAGWFLFPQPEALANALQKLYLYVKGKVSSDD